MAVHRLVGAEVLSAREYYLVALYRTLYPRIGHAFVESADVNVATAEAHVDEVSVAVGRYDPFLCGEVGRRFDNLVGHFAVNHVVVAVAHPLARVVAKAEHDVARSVFSPENGVVAECELNLRAALVAVIPTALSLFNVDEALCLVVVNLAVVILLVNRLRQRHGDLVALERSLKVRVGGELREGVLEINRVVVAVDDLAERSYVAHAHHITQKRVISQTAERVGFEPAFGRFGYYLEVFAGAGHRVLGRIVERIDLLCGQGLAGLGHAQHVSRLGLGLVFGKSLLQTRLRLHNPLCRHCHRESCREGK